MKKIFIYGAGYFGEMVFENIKHKYKILGFIDSDKKKHSKFLKKKKIYSPQYLDNTTYDFIIIASMWSIEIKKFLISNRVIENKIIIFPISEIHKTQKKKNGWENIFQNIVKIFKKNKINYYLDHSGLLGFIRQKDVYQYGDIDIAIKFEQLNKILNLLKMSKKFKIIELGKIDINKRLFGKNFIFQVTVDDIVDLQVKVLNNNFRYWIIGSNILRVQDNFTKNRTEVNFKNIKFKIPKNFKLYLKTLYGSNWFVPSKNWTYNDYANIYSRIKFKNFKLERY